jgi:hypothetical protein
MSFTIESPEPKVQKVTYYPYLKEPLMGLLVYTGTPIEQDSTEPPPDNASIYAPIPAPEGQLSYWYNNSHWTNGINLAKASLEDVKAKANTEVTIAFERANEELNAGYSQSERNTWATQVSEAQKVLMDSNSDILNTLAKARGEDMKALAQKIVDKNAAHSKAQAQALGTYQAAKKKVEAATQISDLLPFLTIEALCF